MTSPYNEFMSGHFRPFQACSNRVTPFQPVSIHVPRRPRASPHRFSPFRQAAARPGRPPGSGMPLQIETELDRPARRTRRPCSFPADGCGPHGRPRRNVPIGQIRQFFGRTQSVTGFPRRRPPGKRFSAALAAPPGAPQRPCRTLARPLHARACTSHKPSTTCFLT